MNVKRIILLLILPTLLSANLGAETAMVDNNPIHENILKVGYGFSSTLDPYLSPLRYTGQQIYIGNEWWQDFRHPSANRWMHVGQVDATGQRAISHAGNNYFYALGIRSGWGACYTWNILSGTDTKHHTFSGLQIMVGPYLGADFMLREHASEVNKPYSLDLGIDAMAMAAISAQWHVRSASFRLRYLARTNLIGTQFAPEYWQSYFEIYENGVLPTIMASGPWNRNIIRHELTLDLGGKHATWRIGAEHEYLRYHNANRNMTWTRNQVNIILGCIWHYRVDGKVL